MSSFFTEAVDKHLAWFAMWHRLAFFPEHSRAEAVKKLEVPEQFLPPAKDRPADLQIDQPAVERLAVLYEQLHTLARLVLIKTPDNEGIACADYDSVMSKNQEFIVGLRRMERAFATASSALDQLTGLRNRQGMMEDITREHSRFQRSGKSFCIAAIDIDFFKKVNDSFGHDAGDAVLAAVASHISNSLRIYDDVYRMGGEEFLICLKETDLPLCYVILERMRQKLEQMPIKLPAGEIMHVTASFGFAMSTDRYTPEELIRMADQALYHAKSKGRNRVVAAKDIL